MSIHRVPLATAALLSAQVGHATADQLTVPSPEYPTISAAVAAAVAGDEIVLLDGEFTGAANWNLVVAEPITIRSDGGDPTAVVWLGPEFVFERLEDRALTISAEVTIEGITFREFAGDVGGAIFVDGGALTVDACRFEDNYNGDEFGCQDRLGGAIAALGGDLTLRDTVFTGNRSTHPGCTGTGRAEGGAVYVRDGQLLATGCRFEGNLASGNSSGGGGAIATRDADAVIQDCAFVDNEASATDFAQGGAISVRDGTLAMQDVLIEGCRVEDAAEAAGGALSTFGAVAIDLVNVRLLGNVAQASEFVNGGAIHMRGFFSGPARLDATNVVIADNVARLRFGGTPPEREAVGGAASLARVSTTFAHTTLVGNEADSPGEIMVIDDAVVVLRNSIVRGDPSATRLGGMIEATYSNIEGGLPGEGNIDQEPVYLAGSLRLASGSPGVDAGSVGLIPADVLDIDGDGDTAEPLPLDLDGAARRADDAATPDTGSGPAPLPDMGAYEFGVACPADIDGDGELTIFDFLAFQNAFDTGDPLADFDGDGELTLFDFLAFQNAFDAGC